MVIDYYKLLCDAIPIIGYTARIDNHEILDMSDAMLRHLHITDNSHINSKCYKLIQGKNQPCQFCNNSKLKCGEYCNYYAYNTIMNSHLAIRDTLIPHEKFGMVRAEACFDITDDINQLKALNTQTSYNRALGECAKTLINISDTASAIETLLRILCTFFDGDYSCIMTYQDDIASILYQYVTLRAEYDPAESFGRRTVEYMEYWYKFSTKKHKIFVDKDSLSPDSELHDLLEMAELNSIILASLRKNDQIMGTICIGNPNINTEDIRILRTISGFIVSFIEKQQLIAELEKISYEDMLTGLRNRNAYEKEIQNLYSTPLHSLGIIFADINGLKETNDNLGHEYGDILIKWTSNYLKVSIPFTVFRIGGDEFVAFVINESEDEFNRIANAIQNGLSEMVYLNLSVGYTWNDTNIDIPNQLIETDQRMYETKQRYYAVRKYNHMNLTTQQQVLIDEINRLKNLL